jgi:hypothetical protein
MRKFIVRLPEFQWFQVDLVGLEGQPHLMGPSIRIIYGQSQMHEPDSKILEKNYEHMKSV